MKKTKIQIYPLIESAVFAIFGAFLIYLIVSKRYLRYLTPSTLPWLIFATVVLFALAIHSFSKRRQYRYQKQYSLLIFLLLPLLFFSFPTPDLRSSRFNGGLGQREVAAGDSKLAKPALQANIKQAESDEMPLNTAPAGEFSDGSDYGYQEPSTNYDNVANQVPGFGGSFDNTSQNAGNTDNKRTPVGEIPESGTVILSEENYAAWMQKVYSNPDAYKDLRFELLAYIYAPVETNDGHEIIRAKSIDDFAVARLAMICCAADMASIGFYGVNDSEQELVIGDYYQMSGTLRMEEHEINATEVGSDSERSPLPTQLPIFHVESAKPVDPPVPEYVIPLY